jgi:hypothetical protein
MINKMEHHFGSTRWRITTVQQGGSSLSCNKMAQHCLSTRMRNMTAQQNGAPLSFNKMAHRHIFTQVRRYFHTALPKKRTGRTGHTEWHPHSPELLAPTVRPHFAAAHHEGGKGGQHCAAANTVELECRWNTCRVTKAADIERQVASRRVIRVSVLSKYFINPLQTELNPICYLLILLGDLTFMGTCIVSISNKMQRYTLYLHLETALHVSGGTSTHHQESIQLYIQHLVFDTPLLLSAAIVEELEPV